MKKIFLIAFILLMACNMYYSLTYKGDIRTPYYEFKNRIGTASMNIYRDSDFGFTVEYPNFFQQEEKEKKDYLGYARFVYSDEVNIALECYVTPNRSGNLEACADSLAQKLHAHKTMMSSNTDKQSSAFILSGPVYENEVIVDGYSHYDKFIKSGKILFVYSLTYPDTYKPALTRLFQAIDNWKVLGAY